MLVVAVVGVGELQQFERVDSAVVLAQRGELEAFAAEFVGVDADPAMAGVEQRGAGFGGAGQFGLGDRLVADDELPVDERLVTELLLAVVGRRRRGLAGDADPGLHESLRPDEVDAEAFELGGGDVDEVLGDVELQLDRRGFVFERQIGHAGDECHLGDGVADDVDQQVDVAGLAGDVERARRSLPHVVRRAPSGGVTVVDELDPHGPRLERIFRHDQAEPGDDHRFAPGPPAVPLQLGLQMIDRHVELVGVAADHLVGLRQGAERGARGPAARVAVACRARVATPTG